MAPLACSWLAPPTPTSTWTPGGGEQDEGELARRLGSLLPECGPYWPEEGGEQEPLQLWEEAQLPPLPPPPPPQQQQQQLQQAVYEDQQPADTELCAFLDLDLVGLAMEEEKSSDSVEDMDGSVVFGGDGQEVGFALQEQYQPQQYQPQQYPQQQPLSAGGAYSDDYSLDYNGSSSGDSSIDFNAGSDYEASSPHIPPASHLLQVLRSGCRAPMSVDRYHWLEGGYDERFYRCSALYHPAGEWQRRANVFRKLRTPVKMKRDKQTGFVARQDFSARLEMRLHEVGKTFAEIPDMPLRELQLLWRITDKRVLSVLDSSIKAMKRSRGSGRARGGRRQPRRATV